MLYKKWEPSAVRRSSVVNVIGIGTQTNNYFSLIDTEGYAVKSKQNCLLLLEAKTREEMALTPCAPSSRHWEIAITAGSISCTVRP